MKLSLFCLIMLAVLCFLCIFSALHVSNVVEETTALLNKARHENPSQLVGTASDLWTNNQGYLGAVLRHDEMDEVMVELAKLKSYASIDETDDFLSSCEGVLAQLEHIREMEWPSLKNIF